MNAAVAEVQAGNGPLVQIRGLSKTYTRGKQKLEVLHHIDLDIARGDFFAFFRANLNQFITHEGLA